MRKLWTKTMKSLYQWTMGLASGPRAVWALCVVAFIESSFFPIPPDLILIPLVLATPKKAFKIAAYATIASVLGGYLGYAIGYFAYDVIKPHLSLAFIEKIDWFCCKYEQYAEWIVFFAGLTPFPYKIITIASGVAHSDLIGFTLASVLARGFRFFLIAALLWKWGAPMEKWIQKNLGWLSILVFILLVGSVFLVKLC